MTSLALAALVLGLVECAGAVVIYGESFEAFNPGNLTGQDGWVGFNGIPSSATVDSVSHGNPGASALIGGGPTSGFAGNSRDLAFAAAEYSELVYTIDVQVGSYAQLDIASGAGDFIAMEIASNNWFGDGGLRVEASESMGVPTLGGFPRAPAPSSTDWYQMQIHVHFASWTLDFVWTNLSTGSVLDQFLGVPYNPGAVEASSWVRIYGWGTTRFDNLSVIGIPQPVVPGDINGDSMVNLVDYGILKSHWLQSTGGGASVGDFNADGVIDITDFQIFKTDYVAFNGGQGSVLSPVPEPATIALLVAALVGGVPVAILHGTA